MDASRKAEMLISVDELAAMLKYSLIGDERDGAAELIWDASNLARHYGRATWRADACPPVVRTLVRNACVRYLNLSESVVQSRAGDESEAYTDLGLRTGTVFFSPEEIGTIRKAAGRSGNLRVVHTTVHSGEAPESDVQWHRVVGPDGMVAHWGWSRGGR
mgnify:FL=1